MKNDLVVDAITRNFEIIGEAANRVDSELKLRNEQIEWIRITGFRNRIIHEYFGVDYEIMWTIIENNMGLLIDELEKVLKLK